MVSSSWSGRWFPVPFVAFCGSRRLPSRAAEGGLVQQVVGQVLAQGRRVGVSCAAGADSAVISAALAAGQHEWLSVFTAFGPAPAFVGTWRFSGVVAVRAAAQAGAHIVPWAGAVPAGSAGPLAVRLALRSRYLVYRASQGGPGSGLVAFVASPPPRPLHPSRHWQACGSGSWSSAALAIGHGLPVVVFPVGCSGGVLPRWRGGAWVPAAGSGVWARGWRWQPAQSRVQAWR